MNKKSGINLSEWAIRHAALVQYLMVVLMVAGVFAYGKLGQKEDPEFTFKAMLVKVTWPGASAEEVERQVTDRVEKKLQEIAEIDFVKSFSKSGETQMVISLREELRAKEVSDVWYRVRKKLGDLKAEGKLPAEARGPFFNDEFGDTFGNIYAFTADGFSQEELRRYIDYARQQALLIQDVAKVDIVGEQEEKIYVKLDSARLAALGIDIQTVWAALREQNAVDPAGEYQTDSERIPVRVSGEYDSVTTISNTPIKAGDRTFRLGDLAKVERDFANPPGFRMRFDGKPALGLAISMRKGGDVIRLGKELNQFVDRLHAQMPVGVEIHAVSDQPKVVKSSVNEFMRSLIEAVVIVLAVSLFSLGLKTGIVVALSIPLVLAMTFLAMWIFGIELQRISLGSLIIALGLLVDDAIIAVEMMALKLEQGWNRLRAATFAYTSTAFPMLTGTLITAATFLPVGLAKSNAGEYTFSLFAVVAIALVLSWVVAVVFTPFIGYKLLKEHKVAADSHHDDVYHKPFYQRFRHVLTWCLHHRKFVIAATFLAFVGSLVAFKLFVQQQFFPASSRVELLVDMWLPQGATFHATEAEVKKLEQKLAGDERIVSLTSYVGGGSPRFYLPLDQQQPHLNYAQLMIMTRDEEVRDQVKDKISQLFETDFPMVRGRVIRLENGPPVGYPVQFRVSGDDVAKLRASAAKVEAMMRDDPRTRHVNIDWGENIKVLRLEIDQDRARSLGISTQGLSRQLNMLISGAAVTELRENDRSIEVVARLDEGERHAVEQIGALMVQTASGKFIPVAQIASVQYASEESIIWRRNRMPTITVRADVAEGVQAADVSIDLWPKMQALEKELPTGFRVELGGSLEASKKSQDAIAAVQPLMLLVVVTLLMLQLQSFQRTLLVLLTAPLGMIGVTLTLILFHAPFGFVAMLGVIALAGMIMRNSVILVDQIEHDIRDGIHPWEAILGSTIRRFRPIMLTAAAAILAMVPLTRSIFWGPMAVAIMGGLLVATVLTLLFLPALYAQWFKIRPPATA